MALDPVAASRLADRIWARGILRSPERIARLREQMLDGDPVAYESLDYLTRCFNRGMPAMDTDGKMITAKSTIVLTVDDLQTPLGIFRRPEGVSKFVWIAKMKELLRGART